MGKDKRINTYPEIIPQLKKVLDMVALNNDLQKEMKAYKEHADLNTRRRLTLGRSLARVCTDCLCAHRFQAASPIMEILCTDVTSVDYFIFMAGIQILENCSSQANVLKFIRDVQYLKVLNRNEVMLELLNYVLRSDIPTPSDIKAITTRLKTLVLKKNSIIDPLTKAYLSFFDYVSWKNYIKEADIHDPDIVAVAEKAISGFEQVLDLPGQNDIFVLKLVEMLECYERYEEAENCLAKYVKLNPTHINSYMYICTFLQKHNKDSDIYIKYLRKLAKLSPSDPFVLVLVDELKGIEHANEKSLKLLFWFLDCPAHTENLKAWKKLSKLVFNVLKYSEPTESNMLKSCWTEIRASFWNSVHFPVRGFQLDSSSSAKVALHKSIVVSMLEDAHPYVEAVLDQLPHVSKTLCSKLQKKLAAVSDIKNSVAERNHLSDDMDIS